MAFLSDPHSPLRREQFCSFISEFFDKSNKIIIESDDNLRYDAVELTLLLKSIGFKLQSLEFCSKPDNESKDIEIEIKCKKSGIISKMKMVTNTCTCPTNDPVLSNNNAFWEIQSVAPLRNRNIRPSLIKDTSCNLLPEITKKTNDMGKAMLTILQQHYKSDFDQNESKIKQLNLEEILERIQVKHTTDMTKLGSNNYISKQLSSTSLSTVNDNPALEYVSNEVVSETIKKNKPASKYVRNMTYETIKKNHNKKTTAVIENYSITSKIDEKEIEKQIKTRDECLDLDLKPICGRDNNLIGRIIEARKSLDEVLLLLKDNEAASSLTVKRKNFKKNETRISHSSKLSNNNANSVFHRNSFAERLLIQPIHPSKIKKSKLSSISEKDKIKKKILPSAKPIPKPDTPRPAFSRKFNENEICSINKASTRSFPSKIQVPKVGALRSNSARRSLGTERSQKSGAVIRSQLQSSKSNTKLLPVTKELKNKSLTYIAGVKKPKE